MECKNGMDLLYKAYYAIIGGIIAVDEKVWVLLAFLFVFCLFFVTLLNYEACDKGNAIKQCSFQNNNGAIVQNKFSVHLYSSFFYGSQDFTLGHISTFFSVNPHDFSLGANLFIQKYHFLVILWAVSPQRSIFAWRCGPETLSVVPGITRT